MGGRPHIQHLDFDPPATLPLNEVVTLRVEFSEFGFGINSVLYWATYEPASTSESTEGPPTDESSEGSCGESSAESNFLSTGVAYVLSAMTCITFGFYSFRI